jgi:prepilin-type N-terminal cleavage/methylation domain-containing protein
MRGFTLLESLIYIALLGVIMSGAFAGIELITESTGRSQAQALLEIEGNFLMKKIAYAIQHSQKILVPEQVASSNQLSLVTDLGAADTLYLQNSALIYDEHADPLPLSNNEVMLTQLLFRRTVSMPGDPESIQTTFRISTKSSNGQVFYEDFSSTSYLLP